mmetsp:Transcript_3023/g.6015  ORF Transcript_3023/g.6015 Transcript_3023/m.6015 type:complete len:90 (-) Transcript_3023:97-366(-)
MPETGYSKTYRCIIALLLWWFGYRRRRGGLPPYMTVRGHFALSVVGYYSDSTDALPPFFSWPTSSTLRSSRDRREERQGPLLLYYSVYS